MNGSSTTPCSLNCCIPTRQQEQGDWGGSIAHAIILPGESTLPCLRERSIELYDILNGSGEMYIDQETSPVAPTQIIRIPPRARQ